MICITLNLYGVVIRNCSQAIGQFEVLDKAEKLRFSVKYPYENY